MQKFRFNLFVFASVALFGMAYVFHSIYAQTSNGSITTSVQGSTIVVNYTGPSERRIGSDWVGIFPVKGNNYSFIASQYVSGASGSLTFTGIPPGNYEARYAGRDYHSYVTSAPFAVGTGGTTGETTGNTTTGGTTGTAGNTTTGGTTGNTTGGSGSYSLSATLSGNQILVSWNAPAGDNLTRDWIAVYMQGANDHAYLSWQYVGAASGNMTFSTNGSGTYEVRYFKNNGYTRTAVSGPIVILGTTTGGTTGSTGTTGNTTTGGTTGTTGNTTGGNTTGTTGGTTTGGGTTGGTTGSGLSVSVQGSTAVVSYSAPSGRRIGYDWVGIYPIGANNYAYVSSQYTNGAANGSLTFSGLPSGNYEARFMGSNFHAYEVSSPFSIGGGGTTGSTGGSTGNTTTGGTTGATGGTTTGGTTGSTTTGGGTTGGVSGYSLGASVNNGNIVVAYQTPGVQSQDWIGIYVSGASDGNYSLWKYVPTSLGNSGTVTFGSVAGGNYQARYFLRNGYSQAAASAPFVYSSGGSTTGGNTGGTTGNTGGTTTGGSTTGGSTTGGTTGGGTGGTPGGNPWPVKNYPSSGQNIIAFGDSLTSGVGVPTSQNYVSLLSNRLGVPIINAGVSGNDTNQALARLDRDVLSKNPKVVIVFLGGNDELRRMYSEALSVRNDFLAARIRNGLERAGANLTTPPLTDEQTFSNLQTIATRIQSKGAVVVLVGLGGGILRPSLNDKYKDVARNTGSAYVPNALEGILGNPFLQSDYIHPNATGYSILADRIELMLRAVSNP